MNAQTLSLLFASLFAIACGYSASVIIASIHRDSVYKKSVISGDVGDADDDRQKIRGRLKGIDALVIDLIKKIEARSPKIGASKEKKGSEELRESIRLSGLDGQVSEGSLREASICLLAAGAIAGFVAGMVFSLELAAVLALACSVLGAWMPRHVLKSRVAKRSADAERHLPEMLDVMALCMRSGLSIDASIAIYSRHFSTTLADELECARRKWSSGLERREEALRKLAATYDSVILGRVVDTIVRCARYGSSMISSLESDAREARSAYRAVREEKIAKAPVKMMVPTGVLILPAMLIMVLGPVLLELMEGGF